MGTDAVVGATGAHGTRGTGDERRDGGGTAQVTVAIVEDHEVVIDGVRSWIDRDPARRVRVVASGDSIVDVLAATREPADVVLLDLELHKVMVIDQVARLSDAGYRVIIFSAHTGPSVVAAALEAGACAYLSKDETREHCVETIVAVATDRPYVTRSLAAAMLADPQLSGREREALLLWFQGMDMGSVARRMCITEHTVKQYIDRARVKYARVGRPVPSRFALLARAIEDGLIRPEEVGDRRPAAAPPPVSRRPAAGPPEPPRTAAGTGPGTSPARAAPVRGPR